MSTLSPSGLQGLNTAALSAALFVTLQLVALPITKAIAPVLFESLKRRGKDREWRNYSVSYVFIWICSICFVTVFAKEGDQILANLLHAESDNCRYIIAFATGYFIADTFDMWRGESLGWDMILHHGIIIVAFGSSVVYDKYSCYLLSTLVAETNTIFLHARKLLLLAGFDKESRLYRSVLACLLLGFPCQRVLPHLWLLNNTYNERNNFSASWMFWVAFLGLLLINCLNFVLLRSILVADWNILSYRFNGVKIKSCVGGSESVALHSTFKSD